MRPHVHGAIRPDGGRRRHQVAGRVAPFQRAVRIDHDVRMKAVEGMSDDDIKAMVTYFRGLKK